MTRAERAGIQRLGNPNEGLTAAAFEYGIETRVQCSESGRVSYKRDAPTNVLSLNVPLDAAANKDAVEEYQVAIRYYCLRRRQGFATRFQTASCFCMCREGRVLRM